jgi:ribose transport system substrate-binding protein
MRHLGRRRLSVFAFVAVLGLLLGACNGDNGDDAAEAPDNGEAAAGPFTIGVSNGFVGSEWRTQMVQNVEAVFAEYEEEGLVDELVIESADVDVDGQIRQIRNLIAAGVDAILVNPNSQTALNAVFEEAAEQGIMIVAIDQEVTSPDVVNVVIDQNEWARISARWLAEELGEGGEIVVVNGIAGHPGNEDRWDGASDEFEQGGIEVLAVGNGDWDQATGQQVMSDLLATYPDMDGVWTQDGMAEGVLRALQAADRLDDVQPSGEARAGYVRMWDELREEQGFETIGVVNPPGVAGTAIRFVVHMLQGRELQADSLTGENTVYVPIPEVYTNDNLDDALAEIDGEPDSYTLDGMLSDAEVQDYFE